MKKVTKFTSKIFGTKSQKKKMSQTRFFPNNYIDYNENKGQVEIISNAILKQINANIANITLHLKPVELNGEDGLYLGTAGIAYMYYHLSKVSTLQPQCQAFLRDAIEYIKPALLVAQKYTTHKKDIPSFLLGNCGIYAVAAVIYDAINDKERSDFFKKLFYEAATTCKEMRFLDSGSDEFFVGRAGYICGALWMAKETSTNIKIQDLHEICRIIVASGREYACRYHSSCPLMYAYYGVEYFGAAHGLCTILQMLMSVPNYLDSNPSDAKDIKMTVDYLLNLQDADGNFPTATDEISQRHELIHWCHGASGMIYLMAKAFLIWSDERYLQSCKTMADLVWQKGLLKKGPGLCHGVAGNGYVFLVLYRLTNEEKYLHRANTFANFMESEEFKRFSRVPDNPFSLFEGIAGTVCFLADLTAPSQAAFPFLEIF